MPTVFFCIFLFFLPKKTVATKSKRKRENSGRKKSSHLNETHKKNCVPDFNNQIRNLCQSFDLLLQEITALFQSFSPELKKKMK